VAVDVDDEVDELLDEIDHGGRWVTKRAGRLAILPGERRG
jgi:hypothetical protein